jgi:phosphoribosylaminoimidazole (AIR) synthetase
MAKKVIKIHQYDDKYITEMHLTKTILKSYGINIEIVQKKRPMHHKTMFHITGSGFSSHIATSLLADLCHLKRGR